MKTTNRKRTKVISMLLTLVMVFGVFASIPFTASAATSGDYEYEVLNEKYVEIVGYRGAKSNIVIPTKIGKYDVFVVGESAFEGNTKITIVNIPYGISYVEDRAFYNCANLNEISLPLSIVLLGKEVFEGTAYYNNKENWETRCLYIDSCLIKYRGEAKTYTIKDTTTVIANNAFYENDTLRTVTFPEYLVSIGDYAFYNNRELDCDLIFPQYLSHIGSWAFYGTECEKVVLPDSLVSLGEAVFYHGAIKEAKLPNNIVAIPEHLFYNCSLTSISFPKTVKYIGFGAFAFNELRELTIPNHIEYIDGWAFNGNPLMEINLPDKYVEIYKSAFEQTDYYGYGDWEDGVLYVGDYAIAAKFRSTSLSFRKGTKYLAAEICYDFDDLKEVNIPDSVQCIGSRAFVNCL